MSLCICENLTYSAPGAVSGVGNVEAFVAIIGQPALRLDRADAEGEEHDEKILLLDEEHDRMYVFWYYYSEERMDRLVLLRKRWNE